MIIQLTGNTPLDHIKSVINHLHEINLDVCLENLEKITVESEEPMIQLLARIKNIETIIEYLGEHDIIVLDANVDSPTVRYVLKERYQASKKNPIIYARFHPSTSIKILEMGFFSVYGHCGYKFFDYTNDGKFLVLLSTTRSVPPQEWRNCLMCRPYQSEQPEEKENEE